jgi:putative pyruvate formate lyase activating enzyme
MKSLLSSLTDREYHALVDRARVLAERGLCCPRSCGVDRRTGRPPCGGNHDRIQVASFHPHKGEEPPVSGIRGAGNVFFSGCTLACVFCQNYPFSHLHHGTIYSYGEFAEKILALLGKGVHNLNLTTFDQYIHQVLAALEPIRKEIHVPVANNCSGYFAPETLEIAISFCDIFLYDLKYADDTLARRYSSVKNYADFCWSGVSKLRDAHIPWIENDGILQRGIIFRHLVLPGAVDNTIAVLERLATYRDSGFDFRVSLMSQYFPAFKSADYPEIDRRVTYEEYARARRRLDELGFDGWAQEINAEGGC